LSLSPRGNVDKSRMYKKLHTPEKEPSAEPFCDKGSFLWCVPERVIMLTKFAYHIQPKNSKNYLGVRRKVVFSTTLFKGLKPHGVLDSLLKFLNVIHNGQFT
jgi:hypothetical protein